MPQLTRRHRNTPGPHAFWIGTYHGGLLLVVLGILGSSMEVMALGSLVASVGYGLRDLSAPRPDSVGPMTVYALVLGTWCSLAHLMALNSNGTRFETMFYSWSVPEYLLEAQILTSINLVIPLVVYDFVVRIVRRRRSEPSILPVVGDNVPTNVAIGLYAVLLIADWWAKLAGRFFVDLGTLRMFFAQGANLVIFALAWNWLGPARTLPRWTRPLLVAIVTASVVYALMFSYMRGEIAYPLFMVFLAMMMRKALSKTVLVAGIVAILGIAVAYGVLAELRQSRTIGTERLAMIVRNYSNDPEGLTKSVMLLVARNCQFAQLSQVVRIVEEEGLYGGQTLRYLETAFIPRLLWPDKPLIAPGQWFAEKLGRGTRLDETRFSNAINMTLAGEFYLNFGWFGALFGLALLGTTFAIIWQATTLYERPQNVVGQIFVGSIVLQSFGSSYASGIPQLVFTYLAMLALGWVLTALFGVSSSEPARPQRRPHRVAQPAPSRSSG